jgi:hypothetical protein
MNVIGLTADENDSLKWCNENMVMDDDENESDNILMQITLCRESVRKDVEQTFALLKLRFMVTNVQALQYFTQHINNVSYQSVNTNNVQTCMELSFSTPLVATKVTDAG